MSDNPALPPANILDEPSIGLHQRDNDKLLHALMNLKNLGNTLIVVEHDEDTMRAPEPIWVARRMRCASPPDKVPVARVNVR